MESVLGYGGVTVHAIVKITVFIADIAYCAAIAAARERVYPHGRYPASTFLVVQSLARPELLVEIEAIAVIGG